MKKSHKLYIFTGVIFLALIFIIILLVKFFGSDDYNQPLLNLNGEIKAESFAPASQPTISAKEKIVGSIKAPVKILVYEDYSNIFSANNYETIDKIKNEYNNQVVVAFRPYATKEKPISLEAAMAVECASEQDKRQEMRDGIFRAVKVDSLNNDGITGWANQIGLDQGKFNSCLTDIKKQGIMLQVAEDAKQFSVYGAPTIFINDELITGARPYDDYQDGDGNKVEGLNSLVVRQIEK